MESMKNCESIKKSLCDKLESWGIDPIRLVKAIGIFLVIVILIALFFMYPPFILGIMIACACVAIIGMIYGALK